MFAIALFPELSHVEQSGPYCVFCTTEGRCGVVFRIRVLDLEDFELNFRACALAQLVKEIPEGMVLRIRVKGDTVRKLPFAHVRQEAVESFGLTEEEVYLSFEGELPRGGLFGLLKKKLGITKSHQLAKEKREKTSRLSQFVDELPKSLLKVLGAKALSLLETQNLFLKDPYEIVQTQDGLDLGYKRARVIRLWKPGTTPLSEQTLAEIKQRFKQPYEFSITISPISKVKAQFNIKQRVAQSAQSLEPTAERAWQESQEHLEQALIDGESYVQIEWLCVVKRASEELMREDIQGALSELSRITPELMAETSGRFSSYRASLFGAKPHLTFWEKASNAWAYLPVFSWGSGGVKDLQISPRLIPFHRKDDSVHLYDQFSPQFLAYCAVINGKTGSGKGALANLLAKSFAQDAKTHLFLIDVGSSYLDLCERTGGVEIELSMDRPCGLNPFAILGELPFSHTVAVMLGHFVCALIQEPNEKQVPSEMRVNIVDKLKAYAQSQPEHPSLCDFISKFELPRRHLLLQWTPGHIYENVFKEQEGFDLKNHRFLYFNLPKLEQASDASFCAGIMAAVIAYVNFQVFQCGDSRAGNGERVVLFADETKFFIERNAKFFLETTANFRKYNHATVIIAQSTEHLSTMNDKTGEVENLILKNSPIRFFYETDGTDEQFCSKTGLDPDQLEMIKNLQRTTEYREVLLQDDTGVRVCRIRLTPEEHWECTSDPHHKPIREGLIKAVPGITRAQAVKALALARPI